MDNRKKTDGQYMTPERIVNMILDAIGYTGQRVLEKKIMEPSFGDGAFLSQIILRIISESRAAKYTEDEIGNKLKQLVYGIEKDSDLYKKGIERLNSICEDNGLPSIDWADNLICGDTLCEYKHFVHEMDYVVGNPPYVRIHNIPDEYRDIAKGFMFVDGMMDLYVIFYEIGIYMLKKNGKLGYISPNSFMKNTSQKKFRNFLIENKYISAIYDFGTSRIFPDADTYTCVCILDTNCGRKDCGIDYRAYRMYEEKERSNIEYDYLRKNLYDSAWNLGSIEAVNFLKQNKDMQNTIADIAIVQNGVATNRDGIYIIHAYADSELKEPYRGKDSDNGSTVYFVDKKSALRQIESSALRRCVKGSRYNGVMDNTYIIFPYEAHRTDSKGSEGTNEQVYHPIEEGNLRTRFPLVYGYLSEYRTELAKRDMDDNTAWYLFGRSQGLQHSSANKIVFKNVANKQDPKIIPYMLESDVIVYSGFYTTVNTSRLAAFVSALNVDIKDRSTLNALSDHVLCEIQKIYASPDFSRYCSLIGKDMSGGYVSVSATTSKHYGIQLDAVLDAAMKHIAVTNG